jgi:hypothetical protein
MQTVLTLQKKHSVLFTFVHNILKMVVSEGSICRENDEEN